MAPIVAPAPMRYVNDYAAGDDTDWNRGKWDGAGPGNDGGRWPALVSESPIPLTSTAVHSVDGKFPIAQSDSHIAHGQRIAGPETHEEAHDPFGPGGRYIYFEGVGFIQTGSPPYTELPRGRIRYIRKQTSVGVGPIYDIIPPEQVHTLWPERFGSTYSLAQQAKWRHFSNAPDSPPYSGFGTQNYGFWLWSIHYPFNGGEYGWDVWYEFQMDPALPLGTYGLQWTQGQTFLAHRPYSKVHMELNVMTDWDPATEDFALTWNGGDSPSSPTNTMKFSDMSNFTIGKCGCYGEFTWPGIWQNTVLACTFDWQRECCSISLESLTSDEEFGPYNTAIETYLSGASSQSGDVKLISKWYDSSINEYYEARSVRGNFRGGSQVFPIAVNAQTDTGNYNTNVILKGGWPTGVSVVRTTQ